MQFLTTTESYISLFFTLALMLVMLYFMIYRPQKKQEKKDAAMRSSLEIGDQVTTIGGVIGRVVAIKDDTFVLETGADRVKIRFTKNAISSVEKLNMDNDQKFVYGRNIFQSISDVVDEMFQNYLSRPNVRQPILTQYCDGQRVTCSNWLSQWGSKYLGDQNYETIEILRYYYGDNMFINTAEEISGIPASWPRYNLEVGSAGDKVRQIQEQLARISQSYPAIPTVTPDGIYGEATKAAVEKFQSIFGLPVTGVVDYRTWYKISEIYVAVTRIAELV